MVEDIVYSGHMLHWSSSNNDLSIADIWGQQYVRWTLDLANCIRMIRHVFKDSKKLLQQQQL